MVDSARGDSKLYRAALNAAAEREGVGFRISETNVGAPGIGVEDIVFTSTSTAQDYGVIMMPAGPTVFNTSLEDAIDKLHSIMYEKRPVAVNNAISKEFVYVLPHSIDPKDHGLSGPYLEYFNHLMKITELTAKLQVLEKDLDGPQHYRDIKKNGDENTLELFLRQFSIDTCGPYIGSPFCNAHPDFADPDPNGAAWPNDMTDEEFAGLKGRLAPDLFDAVMSNYTVVERDGDSLRATPFTQYGPYREMFQQIAAEFEAIAQIEGIDEESKKVSSAYAKACRGDGKNRNRPFDEAEYIWATTRFPVLTFAWGPFEEQPALDHFGIKRGFQMSIYRVREDLTSAMKDDMPVGSLLDDTLRARGMDIPQAPTADKVIHMADTIYSTTKFAHGHITAIAQTIPNDGPVVDEVGRRVDVGVNIAEETFNTMMMPIRERITHPDQRKYVQRDMVAKFAEVHELAHNSGVMPDYQIEMNGQKIGIYDAMGSFYYLLEEGKANAGSVAGISLLKNKDGKPLYSKDEIAAYYITYINNLARQIRMAAKDPHTWGARAELGWLFKRGAAELRPDKKGTKFLYVNVERVHAAMADFYEAIVRAQASGDKKAAIAFIQQDFDKIPPELIAWVDSNRDAKAGRLNDVPYSSTHRPIDFFSDWMLPTRE